jgi:hypothetical protein
MNKISKDADDLKSDEESSMLSDQFNGMRDRALQDLKQSKKKSMYLTLLLKYLMDHLKRFRDRESETESNEQESVNALSSARGFMMSYPVHKDDPVSFSSVDNLIQDALEYRDSLTFSKKEAEQNLENLEDKYNSLRQEFEDLKNKTKVNLESALLKNPKDLKLKIPGISVQNNGSAKDSYKNFHTKVASFKQDTPFKDISDIEYDNAKTIIASNPLIQEEDRAFMLSALKNLNDVKYPEESVEKESQRQEINSNGRHKTSHNGEEVLNESGTEVDSLFNHMADEINKMEKLVNVNDLHESNQRDNSERKTNLKEITLAPEKLKEIEELLATLKTYPDLLKEKYSKTNGRNHKDFDVSRFYEQMEQTINEVKSDPAKNNNILRLLEIINKQLSNENVIPLNSNQIDSEMPIAQNSKLNESQLKKRLDDTMNATIEIDIGNEETTKLWKFLFDVLKFNEKDIPGVTNEKVAAKINTNVRNKLLNLFGADQNHYDVCTMIHCTYYQYFASILKISINYLKLSAYLVVRISEYENDEKIASIKKLIGEESKKKLSAFEDFKKRSNAELDEFYFLSLNEKLEKIKASYKHIQETEKSELAIIDSCIKQFEICK